jgi:CHAD domain-containing protein
MYHTCQEFGIAVLGRRVDAFFKVFFELVSNTTEEAVHQTRIESRRMRAALEAFRGMFPARPFESIYREVRQITRILGAPRESAVSISLIQELADSGSADASCLEYLGKRFASRLKKQEKQLRKRLGRVDPHRLRSRLEFLISIMDQSEGNTASPSQPTLFRMSESALEQGVRVLTDLTASISEFPATRRFDQASDEELHSLRIAAKKTRYAMELYDSIWPGGLSERTEKARNFQQAAGKYNDWSVLCRYFDDEVKRLKTKDSVFLAFGIGRLSSYVELRKKSLKIRMRETLVEFQKSLRGLFGAKKLRTELNMRALSRVTRKSQQRKSSAGKTNGQIVA